MPIAFPTLICDIILSQHPDICTKSDVPVTRPSALTMDFRLLEGKHAADIAVASLKKPAAGMTKRQMIANLREVSKMLGEKKELVDGVIQSLELEQAQAEEVGVGPSHGVSLDDDVAGGDTVEEEMASDESLVLMVRNMYYVAPYVLTSCDSMLLDTLWIFVFAPIL
ncbi:envelope-like protein, partial [Trifolium pratense]